MAIQLKSLNNSKSTISSSVVTLDIVFIVLYDIKFNKLFFINTPIISLSQQFITFYMCPLASISRIFVKCNYFDMY